MRGFSQTATMTLMVMLVGWFLARQGSDRSAGGGKRESAHCARLLLLLLLLLLLNSSAGLLRQRAALCSASPRATRGSFASDSFPLSLHYSSAECHNAHPSLTFHCPAVARRALRPLYQGRMALLLDVLLRSVLALHDWQDCLPYQVNPA